MTADPWRSRPQSVVIVFGMILLSFAAIFIASPPAAATTYVSGFITVDTTWGIGETVYIVWNHVTVSRGVPLTILPGVTVRFDPGMALFVEGRLNANGASNTPIRFVANQTAIPFPWYGVQFNASSTGSITWSTFDRPDRAVTAIDSSPMLNSNTVLTANVGFALTRSSAMVSSNVVQRASVYGVHLNASSAQVIGNKINSTFVGIQAEFSGSPIIGNNVITNTTGFFAAGIWLQNGVAGSIWNNQITGVRGTIGGGAAVPGGDGSPGGSAIGILVSACPSTTVTGNTLDTIAGGRGGNGAELGGGRGGNGAQGGFSAGIVITDTKTIDLEFNSVRNLVGGRGGNGGGSVATSDGGAGGVGGSATAFHLLSASTSTFARQNTGDGVNGGPGGNGGGRRAEGPAETPRESSRSGTTTDCSMGHRRRRTRFKVSRAGTAGPASDEAVREGRRSRS